MYLLATLLILISFTRRIRRYGMENGSFIRTFLKLLYTYSFIFVPPIAYGVGYIPFTIVHYHSKNSGQAYFHCGISTEEYIIKILTGISQGVSFVITWLLFVYPSKVYMTEFYQNTWSGQRITKIFEFGFGAPSTTAFGTAPLALATSTYPLLQIVQYQRLNQRQICRELQNHFFSVPVPGPLGSSLKI